MPPIKHSTRSSDVSCEHRHRIYGMPSSTHQSFTFTDLYCMMNPIVAVFFRRSLIEDINYHLGELNEVTFSCLIISQISVPLLKFDQAYHSKYIGRLWLPETDRCSISKSHSSTVSPPALLDVTAYLDITRAWIGKLSSIGSRRT